MDPRGRLQVSPDALRHEAVLLDAIPHPAEYGAARVVQGLAEAVSGVVSSSAGERFGDRLTTALTALDEQRVDLRRRLGLSAAAYAELETHVAHGLRSVS